MSEPTRMKKEILERTKAYLAHIRKDIRATKSSLNELQHQEQQASIAYQAAEQMDLKGSELFMSRYDNASATVRGFEEEFAELKKRAKQIKESIRNANLVLRSLRKPRGVAEETDAAVDAMLDAMQKHGDDGWKSMSIDSLVSVGLSPKYIKALKEGSERIDTLGKLCEFKDSDQFITNIKGIGENGSDQIDDSLEAFIGQWNKAKNLANADVSESAGNLNISSLEGVPPDAAMMLVGDGVKTVQQFVEKLSSFRESHEANEWLENLVGTPNASQIRISVANAAESFDVEEAA